MVGPAKSSAHGVDCAAPSAESYAHRMQSKAVPPARPSRRVLPTIVLAQCAGTSPWFAVNAVMPDLQHAYGWPAQAVGSLT